MAISSSPASPDREENRPRNLLESETIVWGETNSYSGIGSIWCNNAEDLHYWPIFGLSGSVRGAGSSAASKHLVNVPLLFFVAAFWSVAWMQMRQPGMRKWVAIFKSTSQSCSASQHPEQSGRGLREVAHMVGLISAKTVVYSRFHTGNVFVVWKRTNLGSFLQLADSSRSWVVLLLLNFSRIKSQWAWSTQRARRSYEGLLLDDGSHRKLFKMMNFQLTCPQRINTLF